MGLNRLGITITGFIAKVSGSGLLSQWVSVMEWAGDQRKAQVFGGINEDSSPARNTQTVDIPIGRDRGFLASVAYRNQQIPPVATEGESRKYSTNAEGDTVQSEVFLHNDGHIEIKNDNGRIEVLANGQTHIAVGVNDAYIAITPSGRVLIDSKGAEVFVNAGVGAITLESGTLTHNNKNIGYNHRHSGVQSGSSNTGLPV